MSPKAKTDNSVLDQSTNPQALLAMLLRAHPELAAGLTPALAPAAPVGPPPVAPIIYPVGASLTLSDGTVHPLPLGPLSRNPKSGLVGWNITTKVTLPGSAGQGIIQACGNLTLCGTVNKSALPAATYEGLVSRLARGEPVPVRVQKAGKGKSED